MKNSFSLLEEEDNIRPLPNLVGKLEKGLKSGVEVEVLESDCYVLFIGMTM